MDNNGAYGSLAYVYDRLNADVDYVRWADFIEKCFGRYMASRPSIVLDLACGTGRMTYELVGRGYDMIGVDGSAEMLSEAMERRIEPNNPLLLMQDMRNFELYGSVGAVVCCLDSLNYLTEDGDLVRCFGCVHNYLDPGGLFIFDMSSKYRFEEIFSNNSYILEDGKGEVYCGWQNCYDSESGLCSFLLSVFERGEDGSYSRFDEEQCERYYSREQVLDALREAGLEPVGVWGDYDFSEPSRTDERWYFAAKKAE